MHFEKIEKCRNLNYFKDAESINFYKIALLYNCHTRIKARLIFQFVYLIFSRKCYKKEVNTKLLYVQTEGSPYVKTSNVADFKKRLKTFFGYRLTLNF